MMIFILQSNLVDTQGDYYIHSDIWDYNLLIIHNNSIVASPNIEIMKLNLRYADAASFFAC